VGGSGREPDFGLESETRAAAKTACGLYKRLGVHMSNISRRPASGGLLLAATLVCVSAVPWSDTRAQSASPSIDFHVIDAGHSKTLRSSCFHLSGSIGQPAPGYSSATGFSVNAGFQAAAPTKNRDEIFFNGFEEC
jgi:hypothetical protein